MAKERAFDPAFDRAYNRSVVKIKCSKCPMESAIPAKGIGHHFPPEVLRRSFENKGWFVSKKPEDDLCPQHAEQPRIVEPKPLNGKVLHAITPGQPEIVVPPKPPKVENTATTEDEINRQNNRRIYNKLNEVYDEHGYKSGWADARVAIELAVPRKQVAAIREQAFGVVATNPDMEKFKVEALRLGQVVHNLLGQEDVIYNEAKSRWLEIESKHGEVLAMKATLDAMEALAAKITKVGL